MVLEKEGRDFRRAARTRLADAGERQRNRSNDVLNAARRPVPSRFLTLLPTPLPLAPPHLQDGTVVEQPMAHHSDLIFALQDTKRNMQRDFLTALPEGVYYALGAAHLALRGSAVNDEADAAVRCDVELCA